MPFQSGDRVRLSVSETARPAAKEGAKGKDKDLFSQPLAYPYMNGLVGTVANVYSPEEISVELDLNELTPVLADVHAKSTQRIRAKLLDGSNSLSEEAKKKLTEAELNFTPHFVVLVTENDLQKA